MMENLEKFVDTNERIEALTARDIDYIKEQLHVLVVTLAETIGTNPRTVREIIKTS